MDIFEASDYDFLLSRRAKKIIAWGLLIRVAWVPPVRTWYFGQIEHHAEHLTREFMSRFSPYATAPSIKPARDTVDPVREPAS